MFSVVSCPGIIDASNRQRFEMIVGNQCLH